MNDITIPLVARVRGWKVILDSALCPYLQPITNVMQSLSLISLILPLPSFSEPASGLQQPLVPGHVLNGGKWRSVKRTRTLSSTSSGMCSNWPFIHLPPSIGHELGPREHGPSLTRHCRSRPWQGPWCILGTKQVNVHGRIFDSYNCVAAIARLCPSFPPSHS